MSQVFIFRKKNIILKIILLIIFLTDNSYAGVDFTWGNSNQAMTVQQATAILEAYISSIDQMDIEFNDNVTYWIAYNKIWTDVQFEMKRYRECSPKFTEIHTSKDEVTARGYLKLMKQDLVDLKGFCDKYNIQYKEEGHLFALNNIIKGIQDVLDQLIDSAMVGSSFYTGEEIWTNTKKNF